MKKRKRLSKRQIAFIEAAHKVIDIIDACLVQQRRCDCVKKAERLLRRLVRELS